MEAETEGPAFQRSEVKTNEKVAKYGPSVQDQESKAQRGPPAAATSKGRQI